MPPNRLQGSSPQLQGSSPSLQGSSPTLQGSAINLQQPGKVSGNITIPQQNTGSRPKIEGKSELEKLQDELKAIRDEISRETLPANIDVGGIFEKAQQRAIGAETPQFKKDREIFINRIRQRRQESQQQTQSALENLQASLEATIEDLGIQKERTGQDVARNIGDLNTAEDQFQTDESIQFQDERTQAAEQVAQSGLTTSGLGKQKIAKGEEQRRIASARTLQTIEGKREAQQIFRDRTFADYDRAEKLERAASQRERKQVNQQLRRELNKIAYESITGRRQLQREFEQDVLQERQNQARLLFQQAVSGIADPRTQSATRAAFGSFF